MEKLFNCINCLAKICKVNSVDDSGEFSKKIRSVDFQLIQVKIYPILSY
jgi:hypothetical protein